MDFLPLSLTHLKTLADESQLDHLDVIIDATAFDYPLQQRLAELQPQLQHVLLLAGTPENALAVDGPVLIRVFWEHTQQIKWLGEFLRFPETYSRALVTLSHWPFEALTEHLRHYTQAHWGKCSGILRYYDTRMFKHISGLFRDNVEDDFRAAAISWHWTDRDGKQQSTHGRNRTFGTFTPLRMPLMLDEGQVSSIQRRTAAEQWETLHGLSKRNYQVCKEQVINQIYNGFNFAALKHLKGEALTAYIFEWLAESMPETLPEARRLF
jgi:hypothetical protein